MNYNFVKSMGFKIFSDHLQKIKLGNSIIVLSTISPNSYGISRNNEQFKSALKKSDILVLDGVYFGLRHFFKTGKKLIKNQGPFVTDFFLKKANDERLRVFFMGSSNNTLEKIIGKVKLNYPQIPKIDVYSPPYKDVFNDKDNIDIINSINASKPDILFVGLTCPKQEIWSNKFKDQIDASLICNIGAVFDWIAGNQRNISPIWWKLRLAWLKRTIDRPEILKRYPMIGIFFIDMMLDILKIKKIR